MATALHKVKAKGVGSDRQDGLPREDGREFRCDVHEDWLIVSEVRNEVDPAIKTEEWPWYQGRMNRSVAENQLSKSARFDGTFMVRESDAISVDRQPVYMISVLKDGETHHVEVTKRPDGKYAIAGLQGAKAFKSLKKLVNHYAKKPLDLDGGGKTKLKYVLE